jgi:hypothetical protein
LSVEKKVKQYLRRRNCRKSGGDLVQAIHHAVGGDGEEDVKKVLAALEANQKIRLVWDDDLLKEIYPKRGASVKRSEKSDPAKPDPTRLAFLAPAQREVNQPSGEKATPAAPDFKLTDKERRQPTSEGALRKAFAALEKFPMENGHIVGTKSDLAAKLVTPLGCTSDKALAVIQALTASQRLRNNGGRKPHWILSGNFDTRLPPKQTKPKPPSAAKSTASDTTEVIELERVVQALKGYKQQREENAGLRAEKEQLQKEKEQQGEQIAELQAQNAKLKSTLTVYLPELTQLLDALDNGE